MCEADRKRYLAFLKDKASLMFGALRPGDAEAGIQIVKGLEDLPAKFLTLRGLQMAEADLFREIRSEIGDKAADAIEEELQRRHGMKWIGEDPRRVLARILKRGRIKTHDELGTALEFLAGPQGEREERDRVQRMVTVAEETLGPDPDERKKRT